MTFHLNLSTFLLDSVISPVNLFLQFSQIDYLCFITTLPPPADFVCTVHAWISSERMRRLRKSFHNLAAAVVTSFSANSGQYLPSWFCWERKHFALAFLQYLSFYKPAYKSKAKRKDRHISSSTQHISKHKNPNTQVLQTDWSFMLCVVQLLFQCIIHATW